MFGGMNINEVALLYRDGTSDFGDFVSSFVVGSICTPDPEIPDRGIPGSEARAVDQNFDTFPRFGHTSDTNPNERFRLTIGFNGVSGPPPQSTVQFSSGDYNAGEGFEKVTVTATRTKDTSGASQVKINTTGPPGGSQFNQAALTGTASERRDYTVALGTLRFAPGETTKTFDILITDDAYDDGESFQIALSDPSGASLGPQSTANIHIADNDAASGPSSVRDASFNPTFFVRQYYHDFLGRAPDPLVCRINVSAAFFGEFVARPQFVALYSGLTDAQYVDALNQNAGAPSPGPSATLWSRR